MALRLPPEEGPKNRFRPRAKGSKRKRFRGSSSTEREALRGPELVGASDEERELLQTFVSQLNNAKTTDDSEIILEELIASSDIREVFVLQEAAELVGLGRLFENLMTDKGDVRRFGRGKRRTIQAGGVRIVIGNPSSPSSAPKALRVKAPSPDEIALLAAKARQRKRKRNP